MVFFLYRATQIYIEKMQSIDARAKRSVLRKFEAGNGGGLN